MKIGNSSIERVEEFKYLGTTLTNQNSIQEKIKSGLKAGNACYHSVQNLVSSTLLSKIIKMPPQPPSYTLLINYKNCHRINIHNFDAVHVQAKNNTISAWVLFYLTAIAGHFSVLLHPTCWQSAEWAAVI